MRTLNHQHICWQTQTVLRVRGITPTISPTKEHKQTHTHTSTRCKVGANEAAVQQLFFLVLHFLQSLTVSFFLYPLSLPSIPPLAKKIKNNKKKTRWHSVDVSQAHCTVGDTNTHTHTDMIFSPVTPKLTPSLSQRFLFVCSFLSVTFDCKSCHA